MRVDELLRALPEHAYPRLLGVMGFGATVMVVGSLAVAASGPGTTGGTIGTVLGLYGFGVFAVAGGWYTARFVVDQFSGDR